MTKAGKIDVKPIPLRMSYLARFDSNGGRRYGNCTEISEASKQAGKRLLMKKTLPPKLVERIDDVAAAKGMTAEQWLGGMIHRADQDAWDDLLAWSRERCRECSQTEIRDAMAMRDTPVIRDGTEIRDTSWDALLSRVATEIDADGRYTIARMVEEDYPTMRFAAPRSSP